MRRHEADYNCVVIYFRQLFRSWRLHLEYQVSAFIQGISVIKQLNTLECLVLATDYPADDPNVVAGKRFYGHTPWLPEDVLPGFHATCDDYMAAITVLGKSLLPVWARALELEADFFKPFFERSYTYFRVAKYPPKNDLDEG